MGCCGNWVTTYRISENGNILWKYSADADTMSLVEQPNKLTVLTRDDYLRGSSASGRLGIVEYHRFLNQHNDFIQVRYSGVAQNISDSGAFIDFDNSVPSFSANFAERQYFRNPISLVENQDKMLARFNRTTIVPYHFSNYNLYVGTQTQLMSYSEANDISFASGTFPLVSRISGQDTSFQPRPTVDDAFEGKWDRLNTVVFQDGVSAQAFEASYFEEFESSCYLSNFYGQVTLNYVSTDPFIDLIDETTSDLSLQFLLHTMQNNIGSVVGLTGGYTQAWVSGCSGTIVFRFSGSVNDITIWLGKTKVFNRGSSVASSFTLYNGIEVYPISGSITGISVVGNEIRIGVDITFGDYKSDNKYSSRDSSANWFHTMLRIDIEVDGFKTLGTAERIPCKRVVGGHYKLYLGNVTNASYNGSAIVGDFSNGLGGPYNGMIAGASNGFPFTDYNIISERDGYYGHGWNYGDSTKIANLNFSDPFNNFSTENVCHLLDRAGVRAALGNTSWSPNNWTGETSYVFYAPSGESQPNNVFDNMVPASPPIALYTIQDSYVRHCSEKPNPYYCHPGSNLSVNVYYDEREFVNGFQSTVNTRLLNLSYDKLNDRFSAIVSTFYYKDSIAYTQSIFGRLQHYELLDQYIVQESGQLPVIVQPYRTEYKVSYGLRPYVHTVEPIHVFGRLSWTWPDNNVTFEWFDADNAMLYFGVHGMRGVSKLPQARRLVSRIPFQLGEVVSSQGFVYYPFFESDQSIFSTSIWDFDDLTNANTKVTYRGQTPVFKMENGKTLVAWTDIPSLLKQSPDYIDFIGDRPLVRFSASGLGTGRFFDCLSTGPILNEYRDATLQYFPSNIYAGYGSFINTRFPNVGFLNNDGSVTPYTYVPSIETIGSMTKDDVAYFCLGGRASSNRVALFTTNDVWHPIENNANLVYNPIDAVFYPSSSGNFTIGGYQSYMKGYGYWLIPDFHRLEDTDEPESYSFKVSLGGYEINVNPYDVNWQIENKIRALGYTECFVYGGPLSEGKPICITGLFLTTLPQFRANKKTNDCAITNWYSESYSTAIDYTYKNLYSEKREFFRGPMPLNGTVQDPNKSEQPVPQFDYLNSNLPYAINDPSVFHLSNAESTVSGVYANMYCLTYEDGLLWTKFHGTRPFTTHDGSGHVIAIPHNGIIQEIVGNPSGFYATGSLVNLETCRGDKYANFSEAYNDIVLKKYDETWIAKREWQHGHSILVPNTENVRKGEVPVTENRYLEYSSRVKKLRDRVKYS